MKGLLRRVGKDAEANPYLLVNAHPALTSDAPLIAARMQAGIVKIVRQCKRDFGPTLQVCGSRLALRCAARRLAVRGDATGAFAVADLHADWPTARRGSGQVQQRPPCQRLLAGRCAGGVRGASAEPSDARDGAWRSTLPPTARRDGACVCGRRRRLCGSAALRTS
jgi:hypothetical protein